MSTQSLLAFLTKLDKEFTENTPESKRLEYNLNTHTFTYDQNVFIDEMLGELRSKSIRLTKKREIGSKKISGIF